MLLFNLLAGLFVAPIIGYAAPTGDVPSLERGDNLCSQYKAPPQICTPNPNVTVEETAKRAYQFYKAFVIDGDARTMFSLIDNSYIVRCDIFQTDFRPKTNRSQQHHPGYANGPQAIWSLFCNGKPVGSASSSAWCFDASTNMSYARYSTTDRWKWVDGCVHEHVSNIELSLMHCAYHFKWDQGEKIPTEKCYKLNSTQLL